jgi:MFS family permease
LRPDAPPADPAPRSAGARVVRRLGAALHHRGFRILWIGAFTSTVGTWMQNVAKNWLVLDLTNSSFYLGLDSFVGELPLILFTLIGGVVADQYNRRHLLMGSQYVQMACAFALAGLVISGAVSIWYVIALSFVAGTAQAFGGPAYQSLMPSLVPKADLPNAVALNSIQFNLGRVVGPMIAGTTLAVLGAWLGPSAGSAACFALNGLSFLAVVIGLYMLREGDTPLGVRKDMLGELRGGLRYVRSQPALLTLTALASLSTFLGVPLLTFLPVVARDVFGGGVELYSEMLVVSGVGAVGGALVVAGLGKFPHIDRTMLASQIVFGVLVVAFASSRTLWLSLVLLFLASGTLMIGFSLLTSLVQLIAPDELRGRVMSIYMVAFRGGMPLGSLVSGYFTSLSSAPLVLGVNGALLVVVVSYFAWRRRGLVEV